MALSIDFGTSNTAAAVSTPDGVVRSLLFDGAPLLPSAVCAAEDRIHTGRDAVQWGGSRPDAFEPAPKRRIDDGVLLLGPRELPVEDVIAAVLGRAAAEAPAAGEVVLTHPAAWGPHRRAVLASAAARAGLAAPRLCPEPVAAAHRLAALGHDVPVGRAAVVYDFGGGTFDASVLTRTPEGFVVVASEGLPDAGGLDVDEAVLGVLAATVPGPDGAWERLLLPGSAADRRAARQLREEVRGAKEMLSRAAIASVYLPVLDREVVLGRPQFELVARPVIERTVAATRSALRAAGAGAGPLAAIFMVGGSSRIPLAAVLLHRAFGVAPVVLEQPELVVALGALTVPPAQTTTASAATAGAREPGGARLPSDAAPSPGAGVPPRGTAWPGAIAPGEIASGRSAQGDTTPGEATPGEATPGKLAPGETASRETTPGGSVPGKTASGKAMPGETTLGGSALGESASGKEMPGEATSGKTMPGEAMPGEATSGKSVPGEGAAGETTPGEVGPRQGEAAGLRPGGPTPESAPETVASAPGIAPPRPNPGAALAAIGGLLSVLLIVVVALNGGAPDDTASGPTDTPGASASLSAGPSASPSPSLSPYPPPVDVCDRIAHDRLRDAVGTAAVEFFVPDPSPTLTSINGNRAVIMCYFGYRTGAGDVGVLTVDITDWSSYGTALGWLGVHRRDTEGLAENGTTVVVEDVPGAGEGAFRYEVRPPGDGQVLIGLARADRNLFLHFWIRSDEIRYDGPERYTVTDALREDSAATLANLLAA